MIGKQLSPMKMCVRAFLEYGEQMKALQIAMNIQSSGTICEQHLNVSCYTFHPFCSSFPL